MEKFETQVRKYRREINQLEKDNAVLAKRAEAGEKVSINRELAVGQLKADYQNLQRFVDSLPEEIQRQANMPQRKINHER